MRNNTFNEYCNNYRNMEKFLNNINNIQSNAIKNLVNFIENSDDEYIVEDCFVSANNLGLIIINFIDEVSLDFINMICETFDLKIVLYEYHNNRTIVNLMINS